MNLLPSKFCCCCGPLSENKIKRKDKQIIGRCQRTKTAEEQEIDDGSNCWCAWNGPQTLGKKDSKNCKS